MTGKAPTTAQRRVLENLAAGRDAAGHMRTRSDYGGFVSTWRSLRQRGWVDADSITDAGRAAISSATQAKAHQHTNAPSAIHNLNDPQ